MYFVYAPFPFRYALSKHFFQGKLPVYASHRTGWPTLNAVVKVQMALIATGCHSVKLTPYSTQEHVSLSLMQRRASARLCQQCAGSRCWPLASAAVRTHPWTYRAGMVRPGQQAADQSEASTSGGMSGGVAEILVSQAGEPPFSTCQCGHRHSNEEAHGPAVTEVRPLFSQGTTSKAGVHHQPSSRTHSLFPWCGFTAECRHLDSVTVSGKE